MRKESTIKIAEKVCELYNAGKSNKEIAESVGCAESSIGHYLRIGGIRRTKNIQDFVPIFFKMREEGKTLAEMSEATGFHSTYISQFMGKNGWNRKYARSEEYEIAEENLMYSFRKPRVYKVEYFGKRYVDITELMGM